MSAARVSSKKSFLPGMDKGLWLSKAFYTSFYVAIGALFPYLPVYFKQLRLSSHQNGILIGIRPLIQFCVTPLWGACADRFCKSKVIFLMSVLGWLVSNFLLSLVPTTDEPQWCKLYNNNNSKYNDYNDGDDREISLPNSRTFSLKFTENFSDSNTVTRQQTRKHDFFSRVSPYLDTTVPFLPITFKDLKTVHNVTLHNHGKEAEALRINDGWKDQLEVASLEPSATKPPQDFSNAIATENEYVECDSKEFLFLLLVTVIGTAIAAPAQAFADTVTLQNLHGESHKYGRVRLWGSLGWGIGGFSVGAAVSANYRTNRCGETVINYMPCFYVFAVAMSVAFVCATQFQFDQPFIKDEQEVNVTGGSKTPKILQGLKVFRNPQFCFVMFIAFFCGSATGFIETFLFWYLHELGGGQLLFSVMNGLNCAAEVCVFFVTDKLLGFLGHINVIYVALFCYSIRFIYFYFVKSPWAVLPAELLQGITTAAFWSSCVSYVGLHPGAPNTVQGILNGVYMGLGFASGGFIGGFLVQFAEMKTLFLLYALISFCILIIFVFLNKIKSKT